MRMQIERVDLADADTIRACFQVHLAAEQVDEPDGPWFTERPFHGWLTVGWGGDPRAAEHGRSVLNSGTRRGTGGEAFARAMGADPGLVDVQRVMAVRAMADEQLTRLRESAEQAAAGYSLVSWTGLVPEDFLEQAAALFAALNDAPHDPHIAPAVWDARRVRERVNSLRPHYGLRTYSIAAVKGNT